MEDRDEMAVWELVEDRRKKADYKRKLRESNPGYAEKQRQACREAYRKRMADPAERERQMAASRERKRVWRARMDESKRAEERAKGAELKKAVRLDPEGRERVNENQRLYYARKRQNPQWYERQKLLNRLRHKMKNPPKPKPTREERVELKKEREAKKLAKRHWRLENEPEYRQRYNARMREYTAKRMAGDPEFVQACRGYGKSTYAKLKDDPEKLKRKRDQSYESKKRWVKAGKAAIYVKQKRSQDIGFALRQSVSRTINSYLKRTCLNGGKVRIHGVRTIELIGYDPSVLKAHLESLFDPGMTWENWGKERGQWSIDHIIPQSSFDFRDAAQVKKCWELSNLRPMWAIDNLRKSNHVEKVGDLGEGCGVGLVLDT